MERKELQEGFDRQAKQLDGFTKQVIAEYHGNGIQVDVTSHTAHCERVFLLGKIDKLERIIETLLEGKGETNVTEESESKARGGSKKRASRKAKQSASGQLELGV